MSQHQYIERASGAVLTESLFGDRIVRFLYSTARERAPRLFRALTSARMSDWLGFFNFDLELSARLFGNRRFLRSCGVDLDECLEDPASFRTPRQIFERRIRYWQCRPLPADADLVVSPADARAVVGSLQRASGLYLKDKFFHLEELLGPRPVWLQAFSGGDFAVFRLTPDKYHYNHTPVAGRVEEVYELAGGYHSCNPGAVVEVVTPYSKNRRVVTVLQTDVPGGTGVGRVAMIEVVALMIGGIVQCYSREHYQQPQPLEPGMFLERGQPKSLYRPGSSTDVLLFEPGRIRFVDDLIANQRRSDAHSRFSLAFGQPLVETEVAVRSAVARRLSS